MTLRLQAAFLLALASGVCAVALEVRDAGPVQMLDELGKSKFFGVALVALISGFLTGWMIGPIFGQNGFGGWLIGFIGAVLATALSAAIGGGMAGFAEEMVRARLDPAALLGYALLNGGVASFTVTRLVFGYMAPFLIWLALFVVVQILMSRARTAAALDLD